MIYALLLCLCGTNPQYFDRPTIYIDGYIETNHFWSEQHNEKYGYIGENIFDQLLLWEYSEITGKFHLRHWEMVKFGRERHRLSDFSEANKAKQEILNERWLIHRKEALKLNVHMDHIIVYIDSPYRVNNNLYRPTFNHSAKLYEMMVIIDNIEHLVRAKDYKETNTLYDPEAEFRITNGIPASMSKKNSVPFKTRTQRKK